MSEVGRSEEPVNGSPTIPNIGTVRPIVGPLAAKHRSEVSTDELIAAAVKVARSTGMSWIEIGRILGISGMTTSERYGPLIEDEPSTPGSHAQVETIEHKAS